MHQLSEKELKEQLLELAEYLSAIINNADAELVREAVRRLNGQVDAKKEAKSLC